MSVSKHLVLFWGIHRAVDKYDSLLEYYALLFGSVLHFTSQHGVMTHKTVIFTVILPALIYKTCECQKGDSMCINGVYKFLILEYKIEVSKTAWLEIERKCTSAELQNSADTDDVHLSSNDVNYSNLQFLSSFCWPCVYKNKVSWQEDLVVWRLLVVQRSALFD